jgi:hypothetical protein
MVLAAEGDLGDDRGAESGVAEVSVQPKNDPAASVDRRGILLGQRHGGDKG